MNIEKITELYNCMIQLEELFEAEGTGPAIDCISGLRLSSAEFRTAFFKVRDTLMQCPVSKQPIKPNKDSADSTTNKKKEPSVPLTNKSSENNNSEKPKRQKSKVPNSAPSESPKSDHMDFNEFDEFITESYDFDEKSDTNIYARLRAYRICRHKGNFTPPVHDAFKHHLTSIFKMDGDILKGLKPKLDPKLSIENTKSGKIYRHPYYTDIWCSEDGIFYYRGPSGELIPRTPSIYSGNYTISVSGAETNPGASARRVALECFLQKKLPARSYVFHKNGNKKDFRFCNLCIKGMEDYIKQEKNYCKSDVNECCEYIVAHNKDISNIENDTNFRIGWNFAKNILDKKTYRDISDKYF